MQALFYLFSNFLTISIDNIQCSDYNLGKYWKYYPLESEAMNMIQPISYQTTAASSQNIPRTSAITSNKVLTEHGSEQTDNKSITKKKDSSKDLDDVVAVSEYGDTVQVTKKGQERLEEQEELRKKEIQERSDRKERLAELEEDAQTSSEEDTQKVTSLAGYTSSQLKQLYLKGAISQYAYETQMEKKEEQLESDRQTGEKSSVDNAKSIRNSDVLSRKNTAIESAYSSDSSEVLSSETRVDILDKLDGTSKGEGESYAFRQWKKDFQFILG